MALGIIHRPFVSLILPFTWLYRSYVTSSHTKTLWTCNCSAVAPGWWFCYYLGRSRCWRRHPFGGASWNLWVYGNCLADFYDPRNYMRVCEPLEGISSWSGWFPVAKFKPMRSTSEANIRNLENVFSNIRAFAAITGGAVKLGGQLHKTGTGSKYRQIRKSVNSKHTYNTRTWNYQDMYIITDSFLFVHRPSTLKPKTSIDILLVSYLVPNQRTTLSIGSQMVELLLGARLAVVEMPAQCKMSCRSVVIRGSWFNFCTAGSQLDSFLILFVSSCNQCYSFTKPIKFTCPHLRLEVSRLNCIL